MSKSHLDLVLPVYNPQSGWFSVVKAGLKQLEQATAKSVRLIIVDDGSPKAAAFDELVESDTILFVKSAQNKGKGAALRLGFAKATADIVLFTDVDFPYEIDSMKRMADAIENGADVSLGYREDDYYASVPWFRKLLSEAFRFVLKSILKFPITDTQCGLKGMNQRGKAVFMETTINRFLVDMEFIKRATKSRDMKIEPVVVQLRKDVEFSSMGVGVLLTELMNFWKIFFV
jgi:glycosyltransferase involved in cell wall biosynthesis